MSFYPWIDDELDIIHELEEKYYDVVELWIYNYMAMGENELWLPW